MVGAAEQKAVLPPINLMKPTHQFPILTSFLNHVRLKPLGVKPQEPNVKNSLVSACFGEKLPSTDPSAGRPCVQTKAFFSQMSLLSQTDDSCGACALRWWASPFSHCSAHLGSSCSSWGAVWYHWMSAAPLAYKERLTWVYCKVFQLTWHIIARLVWPSAQADILLSRGQIPL